MLCSDCFNNEGLQQMAKDCGLQDSTLCANCGSQTGAKLDEDALHQLTNDFFIRGSVPPNIGGYAPAYMLSGNPEMETARFENELLADYEMLKKATGQVVFNYGPPLWMLGLTTHYDMLCEGGTAKTTAINQLIAASNPFKLPLGEKIYRVRTNAKNIYDPTSFDTPPLDMIRKRSRFDSKKTPIFYAAREIETCLHECRVVVADEIHLATFITTQELNLLNIADSFAEIEGSTPFEMFQVLMDKLCMTNEDEYPNCRRIAEAIQAAGYDGFMFKSYYSSIKRQTLYNYALFGYPVRDKKLKLSSLNTVKINSIEYKYTFGPPS